MIVLVPVAALAPAAAQELPSKTTPATVPLYQMPRPDYDPPGITLASFLFSPKISETLEYDDNIFASDIHGADDFVNAAEEDLGFASQWSRHSLTATLSSIQQTYGNFSSEDANTYNAQGSGRLDITGDAFLQLDGGFIQQPQKRGAFEASIAGGGRAIYNTSTGSLSFNQTLNRWTEQVQAAVQQIAYVAAVNNNRSNVLQTYRDRISYGLTDQYNLFVDASYALESWVKRPGLRNLQSIETMVGASVEIPTLIDAELSIGALRQSYDDPALGTLLTPVVNGQVTWNLLPLTSIVGSVSRTVRGTESFCTGNNSLCQNLPGGARLNTVERTIASIGAQHELWHDLLGEIKFGYEHDVFDAVNLIDDTYAVTADARYMINRDLEADIEYVHTARTANLPFVFIYNSGPYTENTVTLAIKTAF